MCDRTRERELMRQGCTGTVEGGQVSHNNETCPLHEDGPPPTFTVSIELGNEAMDTRADLAGALRDLAERVEGIEGHLGHGVIRDRNGNTVGSFAMEAP